MNFREFLSNNLVILDGGMGTLLQQRGLKPGEHPELWNITNPEIIKDIHKAYFDAGSNVINANTFGANSLKFDSETLESIIKAALEIADEARKLSISKKEKFIALDIGPVGKLLKPFGDLDFEDAVSIFSEVVRFGVKYGADLVTVETMNDSYETKAAVLAVKENSSLPVIVTNAYGSDGKLMTGASPSAMVAMLEGLRVDALGANCSLGPLQLKNVADELLEYSSIPVVMKPNAGLPKVVDGKTVYDVDISEFTSIMYDMCKKGVRIVGGCCGTTPEYIKRLNNLLEDFSPKIIENKNLSMISSYSHSVVFGNEPILIGERINPTGKKRFKQALVEHDIDYILKEGISQQEKGVHVLDVNVGLPEIDETKILKETVFELQSVSNLPIQIDTSDIKAMEAAIRIYNGKAMVNSVNGKKESMEAVFPIVKKYGGYVVALTLDENGIPDNVDGRIDIAKKIINKASEYGIQNKDLIFDPLAMTISTDTKSAMITLETLRRLRYELGCQTSLGISNVSFGLPVREHINSTFFSMCLSNGLSAAIMNPYSFDMMKTYYSYAALAGLDNNCSNYIDFSSKFESNTINIQSAAKQELNLSDNKDSNLRDAIIHGRKDSAAEVTVELLKIRNALDIIENEIIPALDIVGRGFENKSVYLPQLLISAEAAKASFSVIKDRMTENTSSDKSKFTVVIATVKGDIHDIGKNIVKLLMENYGYKVIDLGKDVEPQIIADCVSENKAPVCCLSALMTTTVPAMEETIKLIKKVRADCKIMVGGAVMNQEYADMIGADYYAKDAMGAVRKLSEINI